MKNDREVLQSKDALFVISERDFQHAVKEKIGRKFDEHELSFAKNLIQEGLWLPSEIAVKTANLESMKTYEGTHEMHTLIIGEDITGIAAYE